MRRLIVISLAVAALGLTGCAGGSGVPTAAPATTASSTPGTTAAPDAADPSTWLVTSAGIGPFRLGADLKGVEAQLPDLKRDLTADCPNPAVTFLTSPAVDVTVVNDDAGKIVGVDVGNAFRVPSSPVGQAHTPLAGPHTSQGIGLGSTLAELNAGIPAAAKSDGYDPDFPTWTVKDSASSWTTFSLRTDTQTVNAIGVWPGALPPSEYCG